MRKISNNKTDLKTSFSEATQSVNLKNFLWRYKKYDNIFILWWIKIDICFYF